MTTKVQPNPLFLDLIAFLATAKYHFATNEPQSYVLGGDSTLYIVTLDILFYLASHAGEVVTKSMLYQQVWKEEYDLNADEALKSQIKKLRQKFDTAGSCKIIETVWGVGYRLKE